MASETIDPGPFAAQLLRSGARAYASRAAERVLDRFPDIAEAFGAGAFRKWHDHLTQRVRELAAAIELSEPEMFVTDVVWSRDAFLSRGVPVSALRQSLEALGETLREDLPEHVAGVIEPCLERAIERAEGPTRSEHRLNAETPIGELAVRYLETALSGDRRPAIALLTAALDDGTAVEDLYERVILATEVEVGTMWHLGEITISEEHVVTATSRHAMGVLCHLASVGVEPKRGVGRVLLSTVEGDHHDLGIQAVADLFEIGGYRTVNLGANTPGTDLAKAVVDFDPALVVLSATMTTHLQAAREAIATAHQSKAGVPVIVGGSAFASAPTLALRLGAAAYIESGRGAVAWLDNAIATGEVPVH